MPMKSIKLLIKGGLELIVIQDTKVTDIDTERHHASVEKGLFTLSSVPLA